MNRRNHNYAEDGSHEVEDLLRQAEDAALLKLSVNGHMAHHSSSDLPPDLADRFQNLKSGPSTSKSAPKSTKASIVGAKLGGDQSSAPIDDDPDDLFARFVALKASLPKPSSASSSSSSSFPLDPVKEESNERLNQLGVDSKLATEAGFNEIREDEVDKIIRWAVDAARLDPSPESDDEADTDGSDSDIDSSGEDDDDHDDCRKKTEKKR